MRAVSLFLLGIAIVLVLVNSDAYSASAQDAKIRERLFVLIRDDCRGSNYVNEREKLFLNFKKSEIQTILKRFDLPPDDVVSSAMLDILSNRIKSTGEFEKIAEKLRECISSELEKRKKVADSGHIKRHMHRSETDPMWKGLECLTTTMAEKKFAKTEALLERRIRPAPGLTKGQAIQLHMRGLKQRIWYQEMPSLYFALLEIAIKGWPDEKEAEDLYKTGWGKDFFRNMAIHLLGEMKSQAAVPVLMEILKDEKEQHYSRAHSMRALCNIASPPTLKTLHAMRCERFEPTLPGQPHRRIKTNEIWGQFRFDNFSPENSLAVCIEFLQSARTVDAKYTALQSLSSQHLKKAEHFQKTVTAFLSEFILKEEDALIRNLAKDILSDTKALALDPETQDKQKEIQYLLRGDLGILDTGDIDDEIVVENALEGKADKKELRRVQEQYVSIVDTIANLYTNGNVFATKDLHGTDWPKSIKNDSIREYFALLASLKTGMEKEEVLDLLRLKSQWVEDDFYGGKMLVLVRRDEKYPTMHLGSRILHVHLQDWTKEEYGGPFGMTTKAIDIVLVFVDDLLRVIHSPH